MSNASDEKTTPSEAILAPTHMTEIPSDSDSLPSQNALYLRETPLSNARDKIATSASVESSLQPKLEKDSEATLTKSDSAQTSAAFTSELPQWFLELLDATWVGKFSKPMLSFERTPLIRLIPLRIWGLAAFALLVVPLFIEYGPGGILLTYVMVSILAVPVTVLRLWMARRQVDERQEQLQRLLIALVHWGICLFLTCMPFVNYSSYFPVKHHCASLSPSLLKAIDPACREALSERRELYKLSGSPLWNRMVWALHYDRASGLSLSSTGGGIEALPTPWSSGIANADGKEQWANKLIRDVPESWPGLAPVILYNKDVFCDGLFIWATSWKDTKGNSVPRPIVWSSEVYAAVHFCPSVRAGLPAIETLKPGSQASLILQTMQHRHYWLETVQGDQLNTQRSTQIPVFLRWIGFQSQLIQNRVPPSSVAFNVKCRSQLLPDSAKVLNAIHSPWLLNSIVNPPPFTSWKDLTKQDEYSACNLAEALPNPSAQALSLGEILAPLKAMPSTLSVGLGTDDTDSARSDERPPTYLIETTSAAYLRSLLHLWAQQQLNPSPRKAQCLNLIMGAETEVQKTLDTLFGVGTDYTTQVIFRNRIITYLAQIYSDILTYGIQQLKLSPQVAIESLILDHRLSNRRLDGVRYQAAALATAMLKQKGILQNTPVGQADYFNELRNEPDLFLTAIGMAEKDPSFFLTFYGIYML